MPTLQTPLGPVEFVSRDLVAMPRNKRPTVYAEPALIRGFTIHYSGGATAGRYRNRTLLEGDRLFIASAIASHNARTGDDWVSDVGYNIGVGRSGVAFEMRGMQYRNAANGTLPTRAKADYPKGVTSSNRYWRSMFLCVGTDAGYNDATAEQWETAKKIAAHWAQLDGIAQAKVNGHRDVRATACPGNVMYPRLGELVPGFTMPPLPPIPSTGCDCAAAIERAKLERLVLGAGYPPASQAQQDAVWWLQTRLNQLMPVGVKKLKVDRLFGDKTKASVIAFQKVQRADDIAHGRPENTWMVVDGIVFKQTWGRLYP